MIRKQPLLICLALAAAVWVVYHQALSFEFLSFDDYALIIENPLVRRGLTTEGLAWAFFSAWRENVFFYPLSLASHMLDCSWFGLDPAGHHLTGIVLHGLTVIVFFLFLRLWTGALWRPALAAGLFALHPLGVESVAWVAERSNLLCAFFVLLTLSAYVSYSRAETGPGRKAWFGLSLAAFVAALLAKPTAVMVPLVLIGLDRFSPADTDAAAGNQRRFSLKRQLLEKSPFFILAGLRAGAVLTTGRGDSPVLSPEVLSFGLIMANAVKATVVYLGRLVCPFNLSVYYPFPESLPWWQPLAAGTILLLITVLAVKFRFFRPQITFGWFWYLIFLAPSWGGVRSGPWPAMADHYVYIPMMGLLVMIVWAGAEGMKKANRAGRFLFPATGAVLLIYFGAVSFFHVRHFENNLVLFSRAVAVTENNYFALIGLGNAYLETGDEPSAADSFRRALAVKPDSPGAHTNLGLVLERLGRTDEAATYLRTALALSPGFVPARLGLGAFLHRAGDRSGAEYHYRTALALDPGNAVANYNLGRLLVERGETAAAAECFARALQTRPGDDRIQRALEAVRAEREKSDGSNNAYK